MRSKALTNGCGTVEGPVSPHALPRRRGHWARLRAWTLYNLSPFDKSIWLCMRSVNWWLLNAIGLIPGINHLWWLLVFLFKDKSDEYQLCDFIIGSESARFFSVGCWGLFLTALRLYVCTVSTSLPCENYGPMLTPWDATAFVAQTLLVWSAYWMVGAPATFSTLLLYTPHRPLFCFQSAPVLHTPNAR